MDKKTLTTLSKMQDSVVILYNMDYEKDIFVIDGPFENNKEQRQNFVERMRNHLANDYGILAVVGAKLYQRRIRMVIDELTQKCEIARPSHVWMGHLFDVTVHKHTAAQN